MQNDFYKVSQEDAKKIFEEIKPLLEKNGYYEVSNRFTRKNDAMQKINTMKKIFGEFEVFISVDYDNSMHPFSVYYSGNTIVGQNQFRVFVGEVSNLTKEFNTLNKLINPIYKKYQKKED